MRWDVPVCRGGARARRWRRPRRAGRAPEVIGLKDGHQVTGEVVAEKPNALYVDLGFDVLRIPRDQVVRRGKPGEAGPARGRRGAAADEADPTGFFDSRAAQGGAGQGAGRRRYGEAVISIETPSGKGSGFIINDDGYAVTNDHVIQGETRISAILYQNVAERPGPAADRGRRDRGAEPVLRPGPAQAPAAEGPETQPRRAG